MKTKQDFDKRIEILNSVKSNFSASKFFRGPFSKMSDKILEYRQIVNFEHHLKVEGHLLIEKKQKVAISPIEDQDCSKEFLIHYRSIDENFHRVIEIVNSGEKVSETGVSDYAVKEFEEHWQRLWIPQLSPKLLEEV